MLDAEQAGVAHGEAVHVVLVLMEELILDAQGELTVEEHVGSEGLREVLDDGIAAILTLKRRVEYFILELADCRPILGAESAAQESLDPC
eukprot:CAMPEP_0174750234 /NCGR_PEP_ID=MMETSP1094-20130205/97326_1 /TAXON_ID=156173 /ORGANISM="Chrysochromulina brevifilum, Strain UTEX LB 985" /LENGTH=89 /DNA_ID=CAMNT_0015955555 /DNA_START=167 /DNA_END=433 /DNA_ORIENTATION=-